VVVVKGRDEIAELAVSFNAMSRDLKRHMAELKITTARYHLPSGVSLDREPDAETWGVEPEVPVRLVRKEMINVYRMRRDADLLGPPRPESEDNGNRGQRMLGQVFL